MKLLNIFEISSPILCGAVFLGLLGLCILALVPHAAGYVLTLPDSIAVVHCLTSLVESRSSAESAVGCPEDTAYFIAVAADDRVPCRIRLNALLAVFQLGALNSSIHSLDTLITDCSSMLGSLLPTPGPGTLYSMNQSEIGPQYMSKWRLQLSRWALGGLLESRRACQQGKIRDAWRTRAMGMAFAAGLRQSDGTCVVLVADFGGCGQRGLYSSVNETAASVNLVHRAWALHHEIKTRGRDGTRSDLQALLSQTEPAYQIEMNSVVCPGQVLEAFDMDNANLETGPVVRGLFYWKLAGGAPSGPGTWYPLGGSRWVQLVEVTNLAPNAGFEWDVGEPLGFWGGYPLPHDAAWFPDNRGIAVTARQGATTRVAYLYNTPALPGSVMKMYPVEAKPGERFLLGGWLRSEAGEPEGRPSGLLGVEWLGQALTDSGSLTWLLVPGLAQESEWATFAGVVEAPAHTEGVRINLENFLYSKGFGTVFFDNIVLLDLATIAPCVGG